jgi:hypothetical protein
MGKKFVSITISITIILLIAVVIYSTYAPNSKKQKTVAVSTKTSTISASLPETTWVPTIETTNTPSTTTVMETIETTTTDISKNLPTLKIIVYEGPVIVQDSDICYYRVEAIVTGNPAPSIKFSKDDSGGAWGKNKAQVNLKKGEIYDLVITAANSAGTRTKHIDLTWSQ